MTRAWIPGHVIVRVEPGAELEHVAAHRDARLGALALASALDRGGALDRAIKRRSAELRATRAFTSRAGLSIGRGHLGYDDVEHTLGLSRTFRVEVDPGADVRALAEELASLACVEMASPQYVCEVSDVARRTIAPNEIDRSSRDRVGGDRALAMEPGDSALIVGLVDSGVDTSHPELAGRLRPGVSSVGIPAERMPDGTMILSGARAHLQDVRDDEGHGTACAGLLSANGVNIPKGLAGAARLLPIRALCGAKLPGRERVTAIGCLPDIDSGVKTAIDLGARVLNLSFGTPEGSVGRWDPVPHIDVVRYALARDCVLVAAAGNTGQEERYFPAALPGVIAVGATDHRGAHARFSTRGDHVAIAAPGERIVSATLGGYAMESGTSFAAPLVTAACALLFARAARRSVPLGPATVRALLTASAAPFADGARSGAGAGVLDVPAALRAFDDEIDARAEAA